ncbi:hypothetical protein EIP91_002198 [Steccherinum ochraceum]|uniref:Uncharacterized protein n=1 Tax=Steccherinum ochraceum TaxID=92696 RepID=A0A4R0RIY0_9APHY|nr:hypothetical protein EIP91_002198 [Steccherinum ochraceum]
MASTRDPYPAPSFPRGRSQWREPHDTSMFAESSGAGSSSPRLPSSASRFMLNVRRSLSYNGQGKKRAPTLADLGMHSTPEESLPPSPQSYDHSTSEAGPSIEEIAMGLHISRTPHLSPLSPHHHHPPRSRRRESVELYPQLPQSAPSTRRSSLQAHRRRESTPTLTLPPPPARSSLKKTHSHSTTRVPHSTSRSPVPLTPSASDASLSSYPSSAPSTPRSNRSATASLFSAKLQSRMSKLLPLRRSSTSPPGVAAVVSASDDDSASSGLTPRKVVRFSTGVGVGDET